MPSNRHNWCPEPAGGTHQSVILPKLLWSQPKVSVLCGSMAALWTSPTVSYVAMVSSTETTASTSVTGVTSLSHRPPGMPTLEPMDTLLAPTTENLLATASISRGCKPWTPPQVPTAPGLCQMRPKMPQQQVPTPGGQEAK